MIFEINLKKDTPKHFVKLKNGYIIATYYQNQYITDEILTEYTEKITTAAEAKAFCEELSGAFALILELEDGLFAAVDRQRQIPLFYYVKEGKAVITDRISLADIKIHGLFDEALSELESSLFITGEKTAAKGVFQILAGEYIVIDAEGRISKNFYNAYRNYPMPMDDRAVLFGQINEMFVAVFKRLIKALDGRRVIIPLSGGHDSRLVAYYLVKLGYKNIVTYTYGKKGNFESTTSEKVAKFLGLEWHFVEYKPKKLQKMFNKGIRDMVDFYVNGVSSVCVQEWYAVKTLTDSGVLKEGDVFVPGHSFDAVAGSFILPHYFENATVSKKQLKTDMINKHYKEGKAHHHAVEAYLDNFLEKTSSEIDSEAAFGIYQIYNIRERQAKYTCNAVRMYEYFGYDWFMPLWDNDLVEFWERIPLDLKYLRKTFFEFTQMEYPDLMKAAPVENLKKKGIAQRKETMLYRIFRKIGQLINYTDYHYCLSYFDRWYVYKIFLKMRILNIGYIVNSKIIEIIRGETK